MKWYSGGIAEAITHSKSKGAVFVVFIEGKDDKSQKISDIIETEEIGNILGGEHFVSIKIEANSVPHQQFSEIYKQTSVPSIYFIGKSGVPLEIVTEVSDLAVMSDKLGEILQKAGITQNKPSTSESFIKCEQPKPPNVVCENGVCTIRREEAPSSPSSQGDDNSVSAEEKLERAKQLLEQKRLEKEREEQEKERQREVERRKLGQNVQQVKRWQEEQELKQLVEEREREKRQSVAARERVLAQIAQDKAERAARFPNSTPQPKEQLVHSPASSNRPVQSNMARLQFKLPDGSSRTHDFPSSDSLEVVVRHIKEELKLPFSQFSLSTTFPRREFTKNDHSQTLADLQLTPNAVILVLPTNQGVVQTNQGSGVSAFVWSLLAPFLGLFNFIKSFLGFGGTQPANDPPGSGTYTGGNNRSNSVIQVRSKYDLENRLKAAGTKLVVIDFFATWCGPCKMIAPTLQSLAKQHSNVVFLKVDVDETPDIARDYSVSSMPTFVFVKSRREVTRFSGADEYQLKSIIMRHK